MIRPLRRGVGEGVDRVWNWLRGSGANRSVERAKSSHRDRPASARPPTAVSRAPVRSPRIVRRETILLLIAMALLRFMLAGISGRRVSVNLRCPRSAHQRTSRAALRGLGIQPGAQLVAGRGRVHAVGAQQGRVRCDLLRPGHDPQPRVAERRAAEEAVGGLVADAVDRRADDRRPDRRNRSGRRPGRACARRPASCAVWVGSSLVNRLMARRRARSAGEIEARQDAHALRERPADAARAPGRCQPGSSAGSRERTPTARLSPTMHERAAGRARTTAAASAPAAAGRRGRRAAGGWWGSRARGVGLRRSPWDGAGAPRAGVRVDGERQPVAARRRRPRDGVVGDHGPAAGAGRQHEVKPARPFAGAAGEERLPSTDAASQPPSTRTGCGASARPAQVDVSRDAPSADSARARGSSPRRAANRC